jgi:hypothetical protein
LTVCRAVQAWADELRSPPVFPRRFSGGSLAAPVRGVH